MSFELRVVAGSRAGEREPFDKAAVVIGRHPSCDFRFDPKAELDVSARHAEIRQRDGVLTIRDLGSTNGTFVNGTRVKGEHELRSGDLISLGEMGPRLEIDAPFAHPAGSRRLRSHRFPRVRVGLSTLLLVSVAGAYWLGRGDSRARDARLEALVTRTDSLSAVYGEDLARMSGQVAGLESALRAVRDERERLRAELERAKAGATGPSVDLLASRLQSVETRREAILSASRVDYSAIAERNGPAVVLIAVEWPDGKTFTGTGFSVTTSGTLVTNKHLVVNETAQRPRRILAIFSDTKVWLPARFVRASADADLALLQIEVAGPFPVVAGIAPSSTSARVGTPVALIGYPLGVDTPMDVTGEAITARSTLGAGTVSKTLASIVQIDAFAGEGSSGSPVFDGQGKIIAVVYGGARESAGRIVYAVPSERLAAFLPPSASGLLR
ncbi:MAG TPA: trypsin-like peptidase domain-containing protein [Gemmatimonadaceae bacterium]|nr:trypsin-like peptidase domain-containing protein [Gemmatimonadaceae bacterium]